MLRARDNDAWAILACNTYVSNDFEFDVLRIGVPWAGFGFLFLVAHGKVRALVQTHGEIGPGRSRWTTAAGSAPAVATAARCDRGDADVTEAAYLIVGHRYQLNYNKLLHHAPETLTKHNLTIWRRAFVSFTVYSFLVPGTKGRNGHAVNKRTRFFLTTQVRLGLSRIRLGYDMPN